MYKNAVRKSFIGVIVVSTVLACSFSCFAESKNAQIIAESSFFQGWKIAMAARAYISNDNLRYDDAYVAGGYPNENTGVCTDVVWNAFAEVGVSIKTMVDKDIENNPEVYAKVIETADPNIDFRRVGVLEVFFERHAESLTTDINDVWAWQAGDIVTFESSHVAIVSNLRNIWGRPYIIQHGKDPAAEEDRLWATDGMEVSGHYRWKKVG